MRCVCGRPWLDLQTFHFTHSSRPPLRFNYPSSRLCSRLAAAQRAPERAVIASSPTPFGTSLMNSAPDCAPPSISHDSLMPSSSQADGPAPDHSLSGGSTLPPPDPPCAWPEPPSQLLAHAAASPLPLPLIHNPSLPPSNPPSCPSHGIDSDLNSDARDSGPPATPPAPPSTESSAKPTCAHTLQADTLPHTQVGLCDSQPSATPATARLPASFVITHSVSKRHNVGTIARCATAFGVKEVCLVGSHTLNTFGSHGSDVFVDFRHFGTLEQCCQHLRREEGCEVIGVEITPAAMPIQDHPFTGPAAFMLGNEGQGLTARQMSLCDKFVYIPQYGAGTASLNVAVAASIVLHHYALWAGFQEREREGSKFVVADRPMKTRGRGSALHPDQVRALRQQTGSSAEDVAAEELATEQLASLLA